MNAIFFVGKVIGLPIVTLLCDKVGRRKPILFGICLCLTGAAIQTASVNFRMLVFSRALIGFSTAFMTQPSPLLIAEVSYPTHRGRITALYQTFYVSILPLGLVQINLTNSISVQFLLPGLGLELSGEPMIGLGEFRAFCKQPFL